VRETSTRQRPRPPTGDAESKGTYLEIHVGLLQITSRYHFCYSEWFKSSSAPIRPFSHWGNATAIRWRQNHFTVAYSSNLQFLIALLPPARPRCDDDSPWIKCSRHFSWSNRSRVASVGERPKNTHISHGELTVTSYKYWSWSSVTWHNTHATCAT
jgi:hypothetical protein